MTGVVIDGITWLGEEGRHTKDVPQKSFILPDNEYVSNREGKKKWLSESF